VPSGSAPDSPYCGKSRPIFLGFLWPPPGATPDSPCPAFPSAADPSPGPQQVRPARLPNRARSSAQAPSEPRAKRIQRRERSGPQARESERSRRDASASDTPRSEHRLLRPSFWRTPAPFARLRIPSEAHSEPRVKPSEGRRERAVTTGSGFRTASGASPRPAGARGPKPRFPPALAHSEGDSLN